MTARFRETLNSYSDSLVRGMGGSKRRRYAGKVRLRLFKGGPRFYAT